MHESDRAEPRDSVLAQIERVTSQVGLEAVQLGGVYDLQRQLGVLIRSSLAVGLGGLLLLFLGVGWAVSRSVPTTAVLFACLMAIPAVVLGAFGHLGIPVDIITSPAANVALALGVDSMIHLTLRARAMGDWSIAQRQMRAPVGTATLVICLGFGIFVFSAFPPTSRFGLAVILGSLTAAAMALLVLPQAGARWLRLPLRSVVPVGSSPTAD